jgi:hypothetical protein
MPISSESPAAGRPLAWERPALAGGIVFAISQIVAAAYFVGVVAPHMPPLDAPLAQQNALVAYLSVLPVPFFLVFLGGLFGALRRLEHGVGVLTATAIGAGVALAMVWPIGIVVADAGQGMARQGLEPAAVMAFDGVAQLTLALSALPRAVLLLAAWPNWRPPCVGPRMPAASPGRCGLPRSSRWPSGSAWVRSTGSTPSVCSPST